MVFVILRKDRDHGRQVMHRAIVDANPALRAFERVEIDRPVALIVGRHIEPGRKRGILPPVEVVLLEFGLGRRHMLCLPRLRAQPDNIGIAVLKAGIGIVPAFLVAPVIFGWRLEDDRQERRIIDHAGSDIAGVLLDLIGKPVLPGSGGGGDPLNRPRNFAETCRQRGPQLATLPAVQLVANQEAGCPPVLRIRIRRNRLEDAARLRVKDSI